MSENGNHGNNDGEVIIDVKNLHKNYGHTEVIKGVDLTVRKGEVICIMDRPVPVNPPYYVA